MTDKKMGRPTDNPKPYKITVRMDESTLKKLDSYCKLHGVERSEVIRQAVQKLGE